MDSNGIFPKAPAQAAAESASARLIDSAFEFEIDALTRLDNGWIVWGWQLSGVIAPGAVATSPCGRASLTFGAMRLLSRGLRRRERLQFAVHGEPENPHLLRQKLVLRGEYSLILPPARPAGARSVAEFLRSRPSLSERMASRIPTQEQAAQSHSLHWGADEADKVHGWSFL
jgi:hypothetical protein